MVVKSCKTKLLFLRTDENNILIEIFWFRVYRGLLYMYKHHSCMPSPLAPAPIRVQSCVCCLFWTNRNSTPVNLSFYLSHYPIRVMNPSIGTISKWKYLLLMKLWWHEFLRIPNKTEMTRRWEVLSCISRDQGLISILFKSTEYYHSSLISRDACNTLKGSL